MSLKNIIKLFFLILFISNNFVFGQLPQPMDVDEQPVLKKSANLVIVIGAYIKGNVVDPVHKSFQNSIKDGLPVLVSGAILKSYFNVTKKWGEGKSDKYFFLSNEVEEYGKIEVVVFEKLYEIYKMENSDLFLFLPKTYFGYRDAFNLEGCIRINFDDLKGRLDDEWGKVDDYKFCNVLEGIKTIFTKYENDYWWNVALFGHGSGFVGVIDLGTIAGLKQKDFTLLVDFFDQHINLFSFFYITCFGGGTHLITPYIGDDEKIKTHSFHVISGTVQDESVPDYYLGYKNLFRRLNDLLNYPFRPTFFTKNPWVSIIREFQRHILEKDIEVNIPVIKFAGESFFVGIDDISMKFITNDLLEKRKNREVVSPIIFSKKVKTILVSSNVVDVPIKIQSRWVSGAVSGVTHYSLSDEKVKAPDVIKIPNIISIDPGPSWHYFSKIIAENIDLKKVLNLFKEGMKYKAEKIFFVKEIICKNAVITDVFFVNNNIYYKRDGNPVTNIEELVSVDGGFAIVKWDFYKRSYSQPKKEDKVFDFYFFLMKDFFLWLKKYSYFLKYNPIFLNKEKAKLEKYVEKVLGHSLAKDKYFLFLSDIYELAILLRLELFEAEKIVNNLSEENKLYLAKKDLSDEKILNKFVQIILKINDVFPIKVLDLSNTKLTFLPEDFAKLTELQELDLSDNKRIKDILLSIEQLSNLQILKLNDIENTIVLPRSLDRENLTIVGNYEFKRRKRMARINGDIRKQKKKK